MKRLLLLGILALCFIEISSAHAQVMNDYCSMPPFVTVGSGIKPNILIILDNSNSMDEDFYGNAAGSFNSTDKLVVGKKALKDIINQFKGKIRVGLESFKIGWGVSDYYIHNSPYFVSYQVKSYCPNPPQECVDWCKNGDVGGNKGTCTTACQAQNALFDPDYFDEIITAYGVGSPTRNKYCELVYPKTQLRETPSNPGIYWYYKQALPFYDGSSQGIDHCYSNGTNYTTAESASYYSCWRQKTDNSDANSGYGGTNNLNGSFYPTDSDIAAGYRNFGRRMSWYPVGRTFFKNSSAGDGYIHVNTDDLVHENGNDTQTYTDLISKLDPKEGDETGYMSCTHYGEKDTCPYIISAGLTPTAGTFKTAIDYFQAGNSPIQYRCQKNFIVFVTDGLPSVNESGVQRTADELMPGVLSRINALRSAIKSLSGTDYTFDIKTYILGVGLTQDAKAKLDLMAQTGGTADADGHAYYADNAAAMSGALTHIFGDILGRATSGTAASVLSSSEGSGANILQAVFFPKRLFGTEEITWTGEMQNLWYYIDPFLQNSNIREDTVTNKKLHLIDDNVIQLWFDSLSNETKANKYSDTDGDGAPNSFVSTETLDQVKNLWEVGEVLWSRNLGTSPRTIYTTTTGAVSSTFLFSTTNASTLQSYLQAGSLTEAQDIINYVHGVDKSGYRSRNVTIGATSGVWKLGDVINSTPRLQSFMPLNNYNLLPPNGYMDVTYSQFISQDSYKNRGMAYIGGNDGMLHAFFLGNLKQTWSGQGTYEKAWLDGSDLAKELWAFIPKNSLPYLKYMADPDYCHLYFVDAPTLLLDASIEGNSGDTKTLNSWKTILIGGMGMGGACRKTGDSCDDCIKTPTTDPSDSSEGLGYSSYFAIDVTDSNSPVLLWEFSHPELGMSTSGPAIIRIGNSSENGKWFAVFASGPTGPIDPDYHQFLGRSDQQLRLFVLDLKTGALQRKIGTGISNAFGGSLYNATLDTDRGDTNSSGHYSDDVFYLGYTKCADSPCTTNSTWTKGGVLRVITKENPDPGQWVPSGVVDNLGPITAAVTKLQDRKNGQLWLSFGSGRFYYKLGTTLDDPGDTGDATTLRALYGVQEPCYSSSANDIDNECSVAAGALKDQTSSPSASLGAYSGWYINLDAPSSTDAQERVITDPLAVFSGVIFFTTFSPSSDVCALGGNAYIWAVDYKSGAQPSALLGKALLQVSTGEIKELTLASAFSQKEGRRSVAISGVPPKGQGLSLLISPRPLRRILHIQEK
jgi:hypothetical protein